MAEPDPATHTAEPPGTRNHQGSDPRPTWVCGTVCWMAGSSPAMTSG